MPDHIHILAAGINPMADQKLWSRSVRRAVNQGLKPQRLQLQPYDHVLRAKEQKVDSFSPLVHYIWNNPVRAGLVAEPHDWSYTGSVISELPNLNRVAVNSTSAGGVCGIVSKRKSYGQIFIPPMAEFIFGYTASCH